MRHISEVAAELGLSQDDIEVHGRYRAKIGLAALGRSGPHRGRYVLVTGMTPGRQAVGKTVTAVGLAMGLHRSGRRTAVALRQSSLGPTFGGKGGGGGGGAAGLVPLEESLLGLGADLFAVEAAHNLLAAVVDDALYRGADIDAALVTWRRVLDVDDRSLRRVVVRLDGAGGARRETGFDITAASELMGILALCRDLADLRRRLHDVVPAWDTQGRPVTAAGLGAAGAMAALMVTASLPNLMQTAEGTPALVHAGPFGNIAPGCSSVVADLFALSRVDFLVTEAGFGADLGGEKFVHLKGPSSGQLPDVAVVVATMAALRDHGASDPGPGRAFGLAAGLANLGRHIAIMRSFGLPVVVAVNRFPEDASDRDLAMVRAAALEAGAAGVAQHHAYTAGGSGCSELAELVEATRATEAAHGLFRGDETVQERVETIARRVYGAAGVTWQAPAVAALDRLSTAGFGQLGVCMAKTPLSLSHDPTLKGAPSGFSLPVGDVRLAAGAGYVVVHAGDVTTMPGLPSHPRLRGIDVDPTGRITGLV